MKVSKKQKVSEKDIKSKKKQPPVASSSESSSESEEEKVLFTLAYYCAHWGSVGLLGNGGSMFATFGSLRSRVLVVDLAIPAKKGQMELD